MLIIAIVAVATALAAAGSYGGVSIAGVPLFAAAVGLAFAIQWIAFVPAYAGRTEKYYDAVGSLTFIAVICVTVALSPTRDGRSLLLLLLVLIWAARLGTHLFGRIRTAGSDRRFDGIRDNFGRFLVAWTMQGLWVAFSLAAALAAITASARRELGVVAIAGVTVWLIGFVIEVVADRQKHRFRDDPRNADRFIDSGLWSWSRHPNYFGEIVLWLGIAVIAIPNLTGWQWLTLTSPLFVYALLTRVSGIPLLERDADERWGGDEEYEAYKLRTPILLPRRPR